MRRLTRFERELYEQATGHSPPFCLIQSWRWWLPGFSGLALAFLVLVDRDDDPVLICHEVGHVAQFRTHPFTFWGRYLLALARVGYWRNPYEQDARSIAGRVRRILRTRAKG